MTLSEILRLIKAINGLTVECRIDFMMVHNFDSGIFLSFQSNTILYFIKNVIVLFNKRDF